MVYRLFFYDAVSGEILQGFECYTARQFYYTARSWMRNFKRGGFTVTMVAESRAVSFD